MPRRPDPVRVEKMAQGLARGLSVREAAVAAGYGRHSNSVYKTARDPAFRARVEDLARRRHWGRSADVAPVIDMMMECAQSAAALGSGAGMSAAHRLLAEAARLKLALPRPPSPGELSEADWRAAYGPRS